MEPIATPPTPFSGALYFALYLLALVLAGLVAYALTRWLTSKAKVSEVAAVGLRVWELAQNIVSHVEVHLRADVRSALADGQLSRQEGLALKAKALELFRQSLGENGLASVRKAFGLEGGGAVDVFLSGLIERALALVKGAPGAATVAGVVAGVVAPVAPAAPGTDDWKTVAMPAANPSTPLGAK